MTKTATVEVKIADADQVKDALRQAADEIERLSLALHAAQKHPDYDYCVTFRGKEQFHHSLEGWEPNPALENIERPNDRNQQYWMRVKPESIKEERG